MVSSLQGDYFSSDVMQMSLHLNRTGISLPGISGHALYNPLERTVGTWRVRLVPISIYIYDLYTEQQYTNMI